MKKTHIIRTLLVMALAIITSQFTFAQRGQIDPEKRAERVSSDLKQALTLDDATTKKIYDLELTRTQEVMKIREASAGNREALRESMKGINEKFQTSIKGIFTEDQFKKYQEWQATQREKRKQDGKGNRKQ